MTRLIIHRSLCAMFLLAGLSSLETQPPIWTALPQEQPPIWTSLTQEQPPSWTAQPSV